MSSPQSELSLYYYNPNKVAPIVFAVLFTVSAVWHLWQCLHYKCFRVTALYPLTAALFAAGFATREYGAYFTTKVNVYFASELLIYFAPPLLELANFNILGRILYYVPYYTPLHPGQVLTTFGSVSVLVEALNGIAVSYLAQPDTSQSNMNLGRILMKTALVLQLCVIVFFCVLAGIFWHRCVKGGITSRKVSMPLITLYISMTLILIRTIYRCVEHFSTENSQYGPGVDPNRVSPLVRHEWFFYVFEASVMLLNSFLWNVLHPRQYLPEKYNTYLAQDGVTERDGPEWKDERPLPLKIMDPIGITAMFGEFAQKDKMKERYWETNALTSVSSNEDWNNRGEARLVEEEPRDGNSFEMRRVS